MTMILDMAVDARPDYILKIVRDCLPTKVDIGDGYDAYWHSLRANDRPAGSRFPGVNGLYIEITAGRLYRLYDEAGAPDGEKWIMDSAHPHQIGYVTAICQNDHATRVEVVNQEESSPELARLFQQFAERIIEKTGSVGNLRRAAEGAHAAAERDKIRRETPTTAEPPQGGATVRVWLDFYHQQKAAGYKVTFRDLAKKSGYSEGTFKNAHEGCEHETCKRRRRTK